MSQSDDLLLPEIATRDRSALFWYTMGMLLPNPDPILKSLGKDISTYRDLRADPQVAGNIRRRKGAVKALRYGFNDGKAKPGSAQWVEGILSRLPLKKIISDILEAPLYGYQPLEVMWQKSGSYLVPLSVQNKPPEWFRFDTNNQLRLLTKGAPVFGELLPEKKFLLATQESTYQNPYGIPDLELCFWATTFKKGGLKFWVSFTEKYGSPWLIGKHPRNTPEAETDDFLDKLFNMVNDAVAVIPDDSSVEVKEAAGKSSSAEVFERFLMYCRSEVNYALLGQNQSSEANSNRASAEVGMEVTRDIREADKAIVEEVMNTLIRWIWELNFNDTECPVFCMWEQESVDKLRAERDKTLVEAGAKLSNAYFKRTYGLQDGDLIESVPDAVQVMQPVNFAERTPAVVPVDVQLANRLSIEAAPAWDAILQHVRRVVDRAVSLEALRDDLLASYADLPHDKLVAVMEFGFSAAALAGVSDVNDAAQRV